MKPNHFYFQSVDSFLPIIRMSVEDKKKDNVHSWPQKETPKVFETGVLPGTSPNHHEFSPAKFSNKFHRSIWAAGRSLTASMPCWCFFYSTWVTNFKLYWISIHFALCALTLLKCKFSFIFNPENYSYSWRAKTVKSFSCVRQWFASTIFFSTDFSPPRKFLGSI